MAKKIVGYDGGDSEEALLKALREALATEVADAWDKIETKYMYIGSICDVLKARYVKKSRLGLIGYIVTQVGYAETTCSNCLRCWDKRHDFFTVKEWVRTTNSYTPKKGTGPLLFLDAHKAWLKRNDPDEVPTQQQTLTLKQARRMIHAYRNMLDRVGGEYVKQAEINQFEPRMWHQIAMERATLEAEMSENTGNPSAFPVTATRDDEGDDPHEKGEDQGTASQTPGTAFHIAEPVVPPPRHPPRPVKATLALVPPAGDDPAAIDATEVLKGLAAKQKLPIETPNDVVKPEVVTPPTPIKLDTGLDADTVASVEKTWNLKGWAGRKAFDDTVLRSKRSSFMRDHPDTSPEDAKLIGTWNRDFWRGERDDTTILARLKTRGA